MSEQQNPVKWEWADGWLAGFVGPATTRNGKGAIYQFTVVIQYSTGNSKNMVHDHLLAYEGRINEKAVEALAELFPTWNKSLLYGDNPVAGLEDLDRVGKELGTSDGKPLPDADRIPIRIAYVLRPWTRKDGQVVNVTETKTIGKPRGRAALRSNTPASALAAAFSKAPPPPARTRTAPKPAPAAYTNDRDGAYAAFMTNGGKTDDFWPRVLEFTGVDNPDKITVDGWRNFIDLIVAPPPAAKPAPPPVAPPPATPVSRRNAAVKAASEVDPDDDIPF